MSLNISKYFWDLKDRELKGIKEVLKNPYHPKFIVRVVSLLSRCDRPKELFSFMSEEIFIKSWPKIQVYWRRTGQNPDFRDWWQTIYEQILAKKEIKKSIKKGESSAIFLKIGKMVRDARINKNTSQEELAVKVGMKQPDISKIEEGKKNITLRTLAVLCKTLDIKQIDFR